MNHGTILNIYIVYEIAKNNPVNSYPPLENCLFGAVKLTQNPDIDKYKYSGYGIGFDRKCKFSFGNGLGQNVIIFGVDMNFSVHANNKTKNILVLVLVLGEGITKGLDDTTLTAEKLYLINFTENNKIFFKACIITELTVIYLLMVQRFINLKQKTQEIVEYPHCLGNISEDASADHINKT